MRGWDVNLVCHPKALTPHSERCVPRERKWTAASGVNSVDKRPPGASTQAAPGAIADTNSRRTPRLPSPAMPRKPKPDESKEADKLDKPTDYVAPGKKWPEGPLADNAPKEARLAQGIAVKILDQIEKNNTTRHAVAKRTGIDTQTLYNVLDGKNWPNFVTVARLGDPLQPPAVGQRTQTQTREPRS